jgi:hypothetical protein
MAAAGGGASLAFSGDGPPANPTYRVFREPPGQHKLAAAINGPFGTVSPNSARWVGKADGEDVYLARTAGGGLCALYVSGRDFGGGCSHGPPTGADVTVWAEQPDDPFNLLVTVPDGYDTVKIDGREHQPDHNVVLTTVANGRHVIRSEGDGLAADEKTIELAK